jgi:hypothetical protein
MPGLSSGVARALDRETAARLVSGLVRDVPHANERREIARIHLAAIESFAQLATALRDTAYVDRQKLWDEAADAASVWLRAVGG